MAKKVEADITDRTLDLKGPSKTDSTPNFERRGVTGRDGKGPCTVNKWQERELKVPMPNGDVASSGDTFDPCMEQMSAARFRSLLSRKYITCSDKGMETKLLKFWETKSGAVPSDEPSAPATEPEEGKSEGETDGGKGSTK